MNPCRAFALQRRTSAAVQYAVAVDPAGGLVPCVKAMRHFAGPLQSDRRRELGIGAQHPGTRGANGVGIEVNDLTDRVHTAVGTAGADRDYRLAGHEGYCRLHRVLDRRRVLLRLPAGVSGAVVLQKGGDAPASRSTGAHVNRAESRSGAALLVSGWPNLPARLHRECCVLLQDRPCPCTPAPGPAWCPPRSWSPVPVPVA